MGSCPGAQIQKCLYRDHADPSKCLSGLYGKQSLCTPSHHKVHRYTTKDRQTKEIISITDCKCIWQPDGENKYSERNRNDLIYFKFQKYVLWLKINIVLTINRLLYKDNTQVWQRFYELKFRNLLYEIIINLHKTDIFCTQKNRLLCRPW